jgi:tRNA(Ile)-lysidine synthase
VLKQFLNHIDEHNLCQPNDPVLLAVSGGKDSMVMLHLFKQAWYSIGVAHCNFQLRGDESDGDERLVQAYCQQYNIPFFLKRFEIQSYADEQKLSVQMAARELRYAWFEEVMDQEQYTKLATAHHLNDSIETVLLNWIKGSSAYGLTGIPVKNEAIIRPLLFATRDEIDTYAAAHRLQWREDSSNLTIDYQRNFIRHKVVPLMKELNPSLEHTVQRTFRKTAGELALLEASVVEWRRKYVVREPHKITIPKIAFVNAIQGAVLLFRMVQHLGFSYEVCENVMENLHKQSGKKFIGTAHELSIDRDHIIVTPTVDHWKNVTIEAGQRQAFLGSWTLLIEEEGVGKPLPANNEYMVMLDADKVTFPLQWRQWREGDRFYPLGMNHRKNVSDLLIDRKVPVADKSRVTVLESGGEIIWVVGHRIDNRYKLAPDTRRIIVFSVTPYFTL